MKAIGPAMLYGLDSWALKKQHVKRNDCNWSENIDMDKYAKDTKRNEHISNKLELASIVDIRVRTS